MSPKSKAEIKHQEILDKGIELLWQRGYNGISVRDIVQSAGVPKGSFYFYFDSKEDFVQQAIQAYCNNNAKLMGKLSDEGSPLAKLRKILEVRREFLQVDNGTRGCLMVNLAGEIGVSHPELRTLIYQQWEASTGGITQLIQEAMDKRQLDTDSTAATLAEGIEVIWRGAVATTKAAQDPAKMDWAIDFIFSNVLRIKT